MGYFKACKLQCAAAYMAWCPTWLSMALERLTVVKRTYFGTERVLGFA
jgi:hypothetical protein